MEIFFLLGLFVFGTMFGSFASVVIYRLKSQEKGILGGRSHCAKCNHILNALDLIPIFSWLANKAKCRYCKEKISSIYPLLELSSGILFVLVGYFLIDFNLILSLNFNEILKLVFWLAVSFITIIYVFYDIIFLEIHEGILASGIVLSFIAIVLQSFGVIDIIPSLNSQLQTSMLSINHSIGFLALGLVGFYIIMLKSLHELWDILILVFIGITIYIFDRFFTNGLELTSFPAMSALVGAYGIFVFFFLQILITKGAGLGGGDLRIAIFIGMLLGASLVAPGTFITYLVGSIIGISMIVIGKIKNKGKGINTQVPFGPFLAIGFFITIFYFEKILNLLKIYF